MPTEKPFRHRAGSLKQSNKPFKSKHATKGTIRDKTKGKTNRKPIKHSSANLRSITRVDRRNAAKLEQQKKREEVLKENRFFEGRHGTPKIVAVIPLCTDVNSYSAVKSIYSSIGVQDPPILKGVAQLNAERFKQKIQFVLLERNFVDILDACKVADYVLFVVSAEVEVDHFGELCLKAMQSQGLPTVITTAMHMEKIPQKKRNDVKKSLLSYMRYFFPDEEKIHSVDQIQDALNVLRTICTQRPKPILWRDIRPYMLAEELVYEANDENFGTLKVTGYSRSVPFSANRLVHLQNFGDFQLNQITASRKGDDDKDSEEKIQVLHVADPELQDTLISENEPNFMENEQTWPTEEEMAGIEDNILETTPKKTVKRVPKGTSSYQAAWIVDSGSDNDDEDYTDEDGDINMTFENDARKLSAEEEIVNENEEEYEEIEVETRTSTLNDPKLDPEEEAKQLKDYLANREKQNRDDLEFPDEVDTPLDIAARTRFQRYRGLQSFRTSPWDPMENLPIDYARIFQFENYQKTKHRVINDAGVGGCGIKVIIIIFFFFLDSYDQSRPFTIFGLLENEHKTSVMNFVVTRNSDYNEPIRSKDPLILCCGFRRYLASPIYSQNTQGKGTNNVHKFERFLNPGVTCVASIYGPIQFGHSPIMLFKDNGNVNAPILVATGSFLSSDPKRIIAKRIILTGHPYKIHKKSAVIRYMFFNPEDVLWFKPVQLTTKYGRIGHIRESLGTHGYMKCVFDSPITQQDTVMMNLYKRIFPKWNTTTLWKGGLDGTVAKSPLNVKKIGIQVEKNSNEEIEMEM
ncbi:Tsr1p [Rhizophagus irregularis DAOM 197198w]|uniref:Tsr1p n=2 Tax=Rhizophagus irregularis (strain DAOM 197198w) TaxID=1432141 RepID=A0A015MUZ9_RHIIW|nr:Tsr1p [Rhizophagus irregularis DAOM 197198w]